MVGVKACRGPLLDSQNHPNVHRPEACHASNVNESIGLRIAISSDG
jgi:hypothetical protein